MSIESEEPLKHWKKLSFFFDNNKIYATVNRIYYSLFYTVVALLLVKNLSSSKHSGIKALFNKKFVKTGVIPIKFGQFYNAMFEFRQRSDYEDFVEFEKEMVKE